MYVWEKYNINYKRALNIQLMDTKAYDVFRRVSGFLMLWIVIFVYVSKSHVVNRADMPESSI